MNTNNIEKALTEILTLKGALATSLFDWESGMVLGIDNNKPFNIELASAGNSEVIKAKMDTMKSLALKGTIEDILITLDSQIHIIHILKNSPELVLYVSLTRGQANLALARNKLNHVAATMLSDN